MKIQLKETFLVLWKKYFGNAELPITFYYTGEDRGAEWAEKQDGWSCLICELEKVRNGESLVFNARTVACGGVKRYLGFTDKMRPGFEYFLSCGNEDMEGERYIRTPEMVKEIMETQHKLPMADKNIVFKRSPMWSSFLPDPMFYQACSPWPIRQRAVIGMFDPSARPCVPEDVLTFSIPMKRFEKMIGYMEETFLITETWTRIRRRIEK